MKDCSSCAFPHMRESYGVITERFREVAAIAARKEEK